jgi:hypothetical protein
MDRSELERVEREFCSAFLDARHTIDDLITEAVLNDVNGGKLELRDAAGLLGMKVPTLVRFAEKHK